MTIANRSTLLALSFFLLQAFIWVALSHAQSHPGQAGPHQVAFRNVTFTDNTLASPTVNARVYYPATATAQNSPVVAGQWPVIAFGHGFNIGYLEYTQTLTHLASWGFYVITPDVQNGFSVDHNEFAKQLAASIQYILAEGANSSSPFFGNVGTKKGCFGHSMGGGATYLVPSVYAGIDAISGMGAADTNPSAITALGSVSIPVQVISASSDNTAPPNTNQQPMYDAVSGLKQFVSLTNGGHCKFTDASTVCDLVSAAGSLSRANQINLSKKYLTAFFQFFLKQDYRMRNWICADSIAAEAAAGRISYQTTVVCPNCNTFPLAVTPASPVSLCPGQTKTLTATSGYNDYTWSDGQTGASRQVSAAATNLTVSAKYHAAYCDLTSAPITVNAIAPFTPTVTPSAAQSICSGDSVQLAGPTGYATYVWKNQANQTVGNSRIFFAKATGSYTLTVTTSGSNCSASAAAVSVTVSAGLSPQIVGVPANNAICSGASTPTTLSLSQGFTTYDWTRNGQSIGTGSSIQVSQAGRYIVLVTNASGCQGRDTVDLTVSSFTTIPSISPTPIVGQPLYYCGGGGILLTVSAEPGALIEWLRDGQSLGAPSTSTTFNATQQGNYSAVRILPGGCTDTAFAVPVVPLSLATSYTTSPTFGTISICAGDSVTITAVGTPGLPDSSFTWFLGTNQVGTGQTIRVAAFGTYSVQVRSQGCQGLVGGPTLSLKPGSLSPSITQDGNDLVCTVSAPAYQWFSNGAPISGATSQRFTPPAAGSYTVQTTDANGCKATATAFSFSPSTAINPEASLGLSLAPNPSLGLLNLTWAQATAHTTDVALFDAAGRQVLSQSIAKGSQQVELDLQSLPAGLYLLRAQCGPLQNSFRVVLLPR